MSSFDASAPIGRLREMQARSPASKTSALKLSPTPETMTPKAEECVEHVHKKRRIHVLRTKLEPKLLVVFLTDAGFSGSFDRIVQIKLVRNSAFLKSIGSFYVACPSYFTAALKGKFKEVQTQTIELREESDTLFERFQLWIYSGSVFSNEETDKDIEWDDLLALYAFGEARNIPHLKNSTINALINKKHGVTYIPSKKIKYVYQNTPSGSQLRKLFVDWSVHLGALSGGGWFQEENRGDYPKDYLIDVVIAQHALAPQR